MDLGDVQRIIIVEPEQMPAERPDPEPIPTGEPAPVEEPLPAARR